MVLITKPVSVWFSITQEMHIGSHYESLCSSSLVHSKEWILWPSECWVCSVLKHFDICSHSLSARCPLSLFFYFYRRVVGDQLGGKIQECIRHPVSLETVMRHSYPLSCETIRVLFSDSGQRPWMESQLYLWEICSKSGETLVYDKSILSKVKIYIQIEV